MRITRSEVVRVALPFKETYTTASGRLSARSMAILRLGTDAGQEGLGEAVPLSLRGGPGLERVATELEACAAGLMRRSAAVAADGEPEAVRAWVREQLARAARLGAGPEALCAIDCALHDLAGRIAGRPVHALLGARQAGSVACNATIDAGEPEAVAATALAQRALGFSTFKVKVGTDGDAARLGAVRDAIGDGAQVRIDANGAWSAELAVGRLAELARFDLELAEQPCPGAEGLARVRARSGIPIVADESVATAADAERVVALEACDAATLKLSKVGGPLAALRIGEIVPSYLSSALDGPIGIAAALHTAQALPREGFASGLAHGLATLEMFSATYAAHEGLYGPSVTPPDVPGLGIEIDEARLQELRTA
jgi:L-alanine-DL-glutamate epimerase-like enolase superfamily enzyme